MHKLKSNLKFQKTFDAPMIMLVCFLNSLRDQQGLFRVNTLEALQDMMTSKPLTAKWATLTCSSGFEAKKKATVVKKSETDETQAE